MELDALGDTFGHAAFFEGALGEVSGHSVDADGSTDVYICQNYEWLGFCVNVVGGSIGRKDVPSGETVTK